VAAAQKPLAVAQVQQQQPNVSLSVSLCHRLPRKRDGIVVIMRSGMHARISLLGFDVSSTMCERLDIKVSAGSGGLKEPRIVSDLIVSDLIEAVTSISRAC
jgi:hypothetical protein